MKRLFLLPVLFLFVFTSCTDETGVSKAFTKYRFKDGVTTITVPGWLIQTAAMWGDLEREERNLLRSIDKVKILTIEDKELNARSNLHKEFYENVRKRGDLEELLVVRNGNEQVTIFGKADEDSIEEMLILVGGDDNAIIYLKGRLKPELIANLMNENSEKKFLSFRN